MLVTLVCPRCRQNLVREGSFWRCVRCSQKFSYKLGILSFLDREDAFNEGGYQDYQKRNWSKSAALRDKIQRNRCLSLLNQTRIRWSMSGRRDRIFWKELRNGPSDRLILDVGCGGGRHYFTNYGKVFGLDPVLELLGEARKIYEEVFHGSAFELPFADESFDYVVSSDVIGHIHETDKDKMFSEMYRVLKKKGRTIHVIETDATNRWFNFAHQRPDLFKKYFVEKPGHYGLELPSHLRNRFLKHGFKEVQFQKMSSNVHEIGFFSGFFDNELQADSRGLRFRVWLDRLLARNLIIRELLNVFLEPFAKFNDAITPLDYATGALVVYEK